MNVTKNHRATGSIYEEKIAVFLKQNGFLILERNYRCKQGEIDIIARDGRYLVFIEVKFRATGSTGFSLEAIDHRKASRIRKAALYYLFSHQLSEETPCRFDAAGIDGETITYIKNAF
ncbi:MAG: YraN family protein [Clostridium sp.]|nr:YraN family protein [Clostridium sp.]